MGEGLPLAWAPPASGTCSDSRPASSQPGAPRAGKRQARLEAKWPLELCQAQRRSLPWHLGPSHAAATIHGDLPEGWGRASLCI